MGLVGRFECNNYIVNSYIYGDRYNRSPVSPSNGPGSPSTGAILYYNTEKDLLVGKEKTLLTAHEVA